MVFLDILTMWTTRARVLLGNLHWLGIPTLGIDVGVHKEHPRHTAWLDQSSDHRHDGSLYAPPESAEETTAMALKRFSWKRFSALQLP